MTRERSAGSHAYDGVPYDELPLNEVDWSQAEAHIRRRAERKDRPNEFNVEPDWATEAASDPRRVIGDSRSRSGESIKVIGYSEAAGRLLAVILVPKSHPPTGAWWGVSAWAASEHDMGDYRERG